MMPLAEEPLRQLPTSPIDQPHIRKRSSGFSRASTVIPPIDEFELKVLLPGVGVTNIDENEVDPQYDVEIERMFMLPYSPSVQRYLYENEKNFNEDSVVDVLRGCCQRFGKCRLPYFLFTSCSMFPGS
jgi:hypothetical protein